MWFEKKAKIYSYCLKILLWLPFTLIESKKSSLDIVSHRIKEVIL